MVHPAAPTTFLWSSTPTVPDWPTFIKQQFGACLPAAEASGAPELHSSDATKQQLLRDLLTPAIGLPGLHPTSTPDPPFPSSSLLKRYLAFTKAPASAALLVARFWSPTTNSWGDPFLTIAGAPSVAERGAIHNASFYWPGPPGSVQLSPGNLPRPDGELPVVAATFYHASRTELMDRDQWINHDYMAWCFDPKLFRRMIAPATLKPDSNNPEAQAWCHSIQSYHDAVSAGCISICLTDPSSLPTDALNFVILPQVLWLPTGFHLPIGGSWNATIGLQGFLDSLQTMSGHSDNALGSWLMTPYVQEWFAAVAVLPGTFATNWVLHPDIAQSIQQATPHAPEVFSFIPATIAYRLHRDAILAKANKTRRESYLRYEKSALATTFTSPDVYMGQHHVTVASDLWYFRPPKTLQWIRDLKLTSYTASPAVTRYQEYILYKVPTKGTVALSIPWLTSTEAREQIAAMEEDDASDDSVTQAWLAAQTKKKSKQHAPILMPGDSIGNTADKDVVYIGQFPPSPSPLGSDQLMNNHHLLGHNQHSGVSMYPKQHFMWTPPRQKLPIHGQQPPLPTLQPPAPATVLKELNYSDFSTTSSDARVRGHALLSLLLTYQDTEIRLVTKHGRPISKSSCLLPMQLSEVWRSNFHLPDKADHAAYWLEEAYRLEEQNAFNLSTPHISPTFFLKKVIEPLKDGRWRLISLETLRENDLTSSFTTMHFLLTLPGFTYPPKLPLGGLTITQILDLLKNIKWLLSTATADKAAISSGIPNPFHKSILAIHLHSLEQIITSARSLNLAWRSNQQRISIQVLSFLTQLFSIFNRWLAHGPIIHLTSDGERSDIPVVDSAVFTNVGQETSLIEALSTWLHEAKMVLCSHHSMHPLLQTDIQLPSHLWETPVKLKEATIQKKLGTTPPGTEKPLPHNTGETPNSDKITYTQATIPLFGWSATCPDSNKTKPVYSILKELCEQDSTIQAPAFIDTTEQDPAKKQKQLCFAYVVAGSRGCSGYMKAKHRKQKCNRAHICLKATD